MKFSRRVAGRSKLLSAALGLMLAACSPAGAGTLPSPAAQETAATVPSSETAWPQASAPSPAVIESTAAPSRPPLPNATLKISPKSTPTQPAASPCNQAVCSYSGPLFLRRPVDPPGNDTIDVTYRFGSTQSGLRDPHHGVEFLNGFGTPVLAAAAGVVVVSGSDMDPISPHGAWPILFYGPYSNFYGNLVVIEHPLPLVVQGAFPELSGPLYTLYGHLSQISVREGQQVEAGEHIGQIGMTGIATGSHLHFEVRLGENGYKASRNPELWLSPHGGGNGEPNGAIAGRFLDIYGNSLEMESIVFQHLPDGPAGASDFQVSLITYEEKSLDGQPPFNESFGLGDLPAGLYRVSFPMGGLRRELVQVYPGQLTVVTFRQE